MIFTSNAYKLIPNVKELSFSFDNIHLLDTGIAQIGFSGAQNFKFTLSKNRIYDDNNLFIGVYDSNNVAKIHGGIKTGGYHYYINDDLIVNAGRKTDQNYLKFYVNVTGTLSSDIEVKCGDIPYSVSLPEKFIATSGVTGYIDNQSTATFHIYDVFTQTYNSDENLFSGLFSGDVASGTGVSFPLLDTNESLFDDSIEFLLGINTSIGLITGVYSVDRVSGLDQIKTSLINDINDVSVPMLFDGSGFNINKYNYVNSDNQQFFTYEIFSSNLRGEAKNKTIKIAFDPVSPLSGQYYESNYVTGFSLTNSGEYLYPPTAKFTGYYYVTGMSYNLNSLLLSSGCSGNVPVIFTGIDGYGAKASGTLATQKIYLQNVYNAGVNYYYMPTSFAMITGGTGYQSPAKGVLNTGIYPNCYDVASKNGYSYLIYSPFNGYGSMDFHAGYLTGIVLTTTGLVNGGTQTGYIVTGIDITNAGFGYDINAFPKMSFIRSGLDNLTKNATGVFAIKQSGYYDYAGHWSVKTGASNNTLSTMTLPSGTAYLDSTQNFLTVKVGLSGKDHTSPLVCKLSLTTNDGQSVYNLISGVRSYDITTGFLKKKDTLESIKIDSSQDLTFLLTQEELDTYYSSSAYLGNGLVFEEGDLDF